MIHDTSLDSLPDKLHHIGTQNRHINANAQGKRFEAKQKCKTHQGGKTQAQKREREKRGEGGGETDEKCTAHTANNNKNTQTHKHTKTRN